MARKKSAIGSILSAAVFTAVAATVGYVTYRGLSSKSAKKPAKKKSSTKRPKGSISRRKKTKVSEVPAGKGKKAEVAEPKVKWIPNLRVREQKILNAMPHGKEVSMPEIAKKFKDVRIVFSRIDFHLDNVQCFFYWHSFFVRTVCCG